MRTEKKNENDVMIVRANDAIPFNPTETHTHKECQAHYEFSRFHFCLFSGFTFGFGYVCCVGESSSSSRRNEFMRSLHHSLYRKMCARRVYGVVCCIPYSVNGY